MTHMHDQAHQLRRLVSRVTLCDGDPKRSAKRIVLSGCKGGVGTSTIAINLAVALRRHANRVLLVDANDMRGDIAAYCRLRGDADIDDVLSGRATLQQVLLTGPAGIQVAPQFGIRDGYTGYRPNHLDRHLRSVGHVFDFVVVDAGCCPGLAETLWPHADQAIVVTSTDAVATLDAYAMIKLLFKKMVNVPIGVIVNRTFRPGSGQHTLKRLSESCRQFLGFDLGLMGSVPEDERWRDATAAGRPSSSLPTQIPSGIAINEIAEQLAAVASAEIAQHSLNMTGVN